MSFRGFLPWFLVFCPTQLLNSANIFRGKPAALGLVLCFPFSRGICWSLWFGCQVPWTHHKFCLLLHLLVVTICLGHRPQPEPLTLLTWVRVLRAPPPLRLLSLWVLVASAALCTSKRCFAVFYLELLFVLSGSIDLLQGKVFQHTEHQPFHFWWAFTSLFRFKSL